MISNSSELPLSMLIHLVLSQPKGPQHVSTFVYCFYFFWSNSLLSSFLAFVLFYFGLGLWYHSPDPFLPPFLLFNGEYLVLCVACLVPKRQVICDFVHKFSEVFGSYLDMLSPLCFFIIFSPGATHLLMRISFPLTILFYFFKISFPVSALLLGISCFSLALPFSVSFYDLPQFKGSEKARGVLLSKAPML